MSSKKTQKEKLRAKQEFQEGRRLGLERQGDEVSRSFEEAMQAIDRPAVPEQTLRDAMQDVYDRSDAGEEVDQRLVYLFRDYRVFKAIALAFAILGFCCVTLGTLLYNGGAIGEWHQNIMIYLGTFLMMGAMFLYFVRVAPLKVDIDAWKEAVETVRQRNFYARRAREAGEKDAGSLPLNEEVDLDEFFNRQNRRRRNQRMPPWPEFRRLHAVWYVLVMAAAVLMVVAVLYARTDLSDVTASLVMVGVAFALLLAAMFIERSKLKPMKERYREEQERAFKKSQRKAKRAAGAA